MSDILTDLDFAPPKYRIGQKVYRASETSSSASHPCPDCLGTGKWKVITPAGAELEASCQRCGTYSSSDIPSLKYQTWVAIVQPLTIGSIQIDTAAGKDSHWQSDPVRYMCRETGIGSGSVYDERNLFAIEDEARTAAEAMAQARIAKSQESPEALQKKRFSHLPLIDATLETCRKAVWDSWYRYRSLREQMEEYLSDESASAGDTRDEIQSEMDFDLRYRTGKQAFEAVIYAASKVDDPDLKAALAALPFQPLEPAKREVEL